MTLRVAITATKQSYSEIPKDDPNFVPTPKDDVLAMLEVEGSAYLVAEVIRAFADGVGSS